MLLSVLYVVGITAEAMTGALSAGKRQMDWFGVMLVASATAIGGGSVRDILLGNFPLTWVKHPEYLVITCIAGVMSTKMTRWIVKYKSLFIKLDAIGLVVFSIIGTKAAMNMGLAPIICVVAAVITGVFGGLLRDLICGQKPLVLHEELYASVALVASLLYFAMYHFGVDEMVNTVITIVVGYSFRMIAVKRAWRLPVYAIHDDVSAH
uniref:trimeric intracellular cation channel family protein n=1 Tax=Thaumasiovibrio occultus TaxID=1891184 RepID=UPI000B35941E|nr:trimeric intracellular cation channel family protein [Thaumasiovibrio occultus]